MLRNRLIHPPLLQALAAAGHGSRVLIADGNYPIATAVGDAAIRIHLNLSPGVLDVEQVLEVLMDAVTFEAAHVMSPDAPPEPPVFERFRVLLRPAIDHIGLLDRADFYATARGPDVAVAIATGDQRLYANLLLTIGVVPPGDHP